MSIVNLAADQTRGSPVPERAIRDVPHYGDRLDEVRAILARATPALFLDFDGVLAPIVDRPDDAQAPPETLEVVARLAMSVPVAVVSGRGLDDVASRMDVPNVTFAGSHGFELLRSDGTRQDREGPWVAALDDAQQILDDRLGRLGGVEVERKAAAIAVHYRNASEEDAGEAVRHAHEVARDHPELESQDGKAIVEVRPDIDWNKGRVVEQLIDELEIDVVPIYIGDDTTDEDAFAVVTDRGIAVVVRGEDDDRDTLADYAADDPADARRFLRQLAGLLGA